ncbi:hypothetical protein OG698_03415 [Streptomyces sp. NBC_01003]|uniref:sigma factor-like helix-turn-helix DNA-binding protein n=1 Tax=Streptomyces sp. NBC_01003 TaxID=2903714 RepID=UPI00386737AB|nr:hypothetical protein OG698_03415 [Streptomyces sp. NBC_01003]
MCTAADAGGTVRARPPPLWTRHHLDRRRLLGPLGKAEFRDTAAFATVHLMERLSPSERAVFVLREAFELSYDEIARVLDTTVSNCRQMHHRAGRRVTSVRDRFTLSEDDHAELLARSWKPRGAAISRARATCRPRMSSPGTTTAARSGLRCARAWAAIT